MIRLRGDARLMSGDGPGRPVRELEVASLGNSVNVRSFRKKRFKMLPGFPSLAIQIDNGTLFKTGNIGG